MMQCKGLVTGSLGQWQQRIQEFFSAVGMGMPCVSWMRYTAPWHHGNHIFDALEVLKNGAEAMTMPWF